MGESIFWDNADEGRVERLNLAIDAMNEEWRIQVMKLIAKEHPGIMQFAFFRVVIENAEKEIAEKIVSAECPYCHDQIYGMANDIDSGMRRHIEYCPLAPINREPDNEDDIGDDVSSHDKEIGH